MTFEQQRISFSCEQMYRTDTQTSFFPELFIFFFLILNVLHCCNLIRIKLATLWFIFIRVVRIFINWSKSHLFLSINNNIRHIFFLAQRTHFFCLEINAVLKIVHDVFLWIVFMWILLFADCLTMDKLMSVQNVEDEEMCMFKM